MEQSDWTAAAELLMEQGRAQHPPPTNDEIERLFARQLTDAEAERVREALVYYPELVRVFTTPFPTPEEAEAVLSREEIEEDIAKIRKRLGMT